MNHPTHPHTTLVEQVFEAVQANDPERLLEVAHPEVEWTPTAWSGDPLYRGRDEVRAWLSQFGEELEHLDTWVREVETRGQRSAVRGIVFDTRGDQTFAVEVAWSFEIEDGLIRRGRAHGSWEEALRDAGVG